MPEDAIGFHGKALAIAPTLEKMPHKLPSKREGVIQHAKLLRMVKEFDKKFPPSAGLAYTQKDLRRRQGPDLHRISQQSKKVDRLMAQLLVEAITLEVPDLPKGVKKGLPKAADKFVRDFNRKIHEYIQEMRAEGMKQALQSLRETGRLKK